MTASRQDDESIELYEKWGNSVRVEKVRSGLSTTRLIEAGVAERGESWFRCSSRDPDPRDQQPGQIDREATFDLARAVIERVPRLLPVERLTVVDGSSTHRIRDSEGSREWSETASGIHLAVTHPELPFRISFDLGATSRKDISLDAISPACQALLSIAEGAPAFPPRLDLTLAPPVFAALLSQLSPWGSPEHSCEPAGGPPARIHQRALPGQRDGTGRVVSSLQLNGVGNGAANPFPNLFRPGYRIAPVRVPFNVAAELKRAAADSGGTTALALLAPPEWEKNNLVLRLLTVSAAGTSAPLVVRATREKWLMSARHAGGVETWFPYSAGVFGSSVTIEDLSSG